LKEAKRYLSQNLHHPLLNYETSNEQVMREIHYLRQLYALYPEMIVSYDRHALHGIEDTELRMTFAFNLQCRNYDLLLAHGPYGKQFIDPDLVVLRSEEHTSELQSRFALVCRLLLETTRGRRAPPASARPSCRRP